MIPPINDLSKHLADALPPASKICLFCGKSQSKEHRLRKCARCKVSAYCSTECQREHWPVHKLECHRILSGPSLTAKHFGSYTNMHSWAIETAAHAFALLNFGTDYLSRLGNHLIYFRFVPTSAVADASLPRGDTPEDAYKLVDISAKAYADLHGGPHPNTRCPVKFLHQHRAAMTEQFIRATAEYGLTAPQGVLHIGLAVPKEGVEGVVDTAYKYLPKWPAVAKGPSLDNPAVRAALEDLVRLCSNSLRTALPFQPVDLNVVCPGRFERVRLGEQRVWRPLFTSWDVYAAGRTGVGRLDALEGLTEGWSPDVLATLLDAFEMPCRLRTQEEAV